MCFGNSGFGQNTSMSRGEATKTNGASYPLNKEFHCIYVCYWKSRQHNLNFLTFFWASFSKTSQFSTLLLYFDNIQQKSYHPNSCSCFVLKKQVVSSAPLSPLITLLLLLILCERSSDPLVMISSGITFKIYNILGICHPKVKPKDGDQLFQMNIRKTQMLLIRGNHTVELMKTTVVVRVE